MQLFDLSHTLSISTVHKESYSVTYKRTCNYILPYDPGTPVDLVKYSTKGIVHCIKIAIVVYDSTCLTCKLGYCRMLFNLSYVLGVSAVHEQTEHSHGHWLLLKLEGDCLDLCASSLELHQLGYGRLEWGGEGGEGEGREGRGGRGEGEGREGGGEGEAIDVFLKSTMCSFACGGREGREGGREGGREVTTACKMRERARGRE